MALKVGEKAPDFELYGKEAGADAPTYRLSDALAGSGVVLQFFPLPFTRTCLAQMCAVRDDLDRYSRRGVTVWGVTGHYPQLIAAGTGRTTSACPSWPTTTRGEPGLRRPV